MRRTRDVVVVLIGVAATWWLLSQLFGLIGHFADVLALFGFAWLLNLLLEPLVESLTPRVPRGVAWGIGYGCVLLVLLLLALPLAAQASTLPATLPEAIAQVTSQADGFLTWLRNHRIPVPASAQTALENSELTSQFGATLLSWSVAILSIGGQTLLVICIAASMAAGDQAIWSILLLLLPQAWREEARWLYGDVQRTYSAAIRGQLAVWALGLTLSLGIMAAFNTPNILLWIGPLALVRLLPYFGGLGGGMLTVMILLLSLPWPQALAPAILVVVGQSIMGYVVEPLVLGRVLQLSPALVLFVALVGWKIGGITGIAFGVPAVAVLQALAERIVTRREAARTPAPPADEPAARTPASPDPTPSPPSLTEPVRTRQ